MLHVASVHWRSDRWIDIQRQYLSRNVGVPFQTYASLEGIDPEERSRFDHVSDVGGGHADKLNALAEAILARADEDDPVIFLDGDAFPIAPLDRWVGTTLDRYPLAAVRRAESLGDPQPHPCFCATTAGFWSKIGGDWRAGKTWRDQRGEVVTDVGGALWGALEAQQIEWLQLLRTNTVNLHPLMFGIYGGVVYHHGAGFRRPLSRVDLPRSVQLLAKLDPSAAAGWPVARPPGFESQGDHPEGRRSLKKRMTWSLTQRMWNRRRESNIRLDESVYADIKSDPDFYKRFLRTG